MTVLDVLNNKCQTSQDAPVKKLPSLAEKLRKQITPHLGMIQGQLPEFDIHDESHSIKIVENIEKLLGNEIIGNLSPYELFLIYTSAYLHDCAMALPQWELNILKFAEGQEGYYDNSLPLNWFLDGKTPLKMSEAKKMIVEKKDKIYGTFESTRDFIFSCQSEDELLNDLSERLIDYQIFRNGYIDRLKNKVDSNDIVSYLAESNEIRYNYVRSTHTMRIEKYVKYLSNLFSAELGGNWGKALAEDLAVICVSHGENFAFVEKQKHRAVYYGDNSSNIQFICMMLRLGDIIHFSYDRAPVSFFTEKMISSEESRKHWKTKMQGVSYNITTDTNKNVKISFLAYCDEQPDFYYFLLDYIKWIEYEIQNYNKFIRNIEQNSEVVPLMGKYKILLNDLVDKSGIGYDKVRFEPDENMCFTLNQKMILELLMGDKLYKDKYLCLRELYQNSLDSCRCMASANPDKKGIIEFGMGEEIINGNKKRYVYCLDNGMGMTREIINKHFLKIGNSYYNSPEFYRKNIEWGSKFTPTSQFGIGVLSCFMLGDRIDITTKHVDEKEAIRFIINGPQEHLYFTKPDRVDLEDKLTDHGVLIKIYIKDDIKLNTKPVDEFKWVTLYNRPNTKILPEEELSNIKNYLLYIIQQYVKKTCSNIELFVRLEDSRRSILKWDAKFIEIDYLDINNLINFIFGYYNESKKEETRLLLQRTMLEIEILSISCEHHGIEYLNNLCLPKHNRVECDSKDLSFFHRMLIRNRGYLIDGIDIAKPYEIEIFNDRNYDYHDYIINFTGKVRPQISVDRTKIVSISDKLRQDIDELERKIARNEISIIWDYILKNNIIWNSKLASEIWSYYFERRNWLIMSHFREILENDARIYLEEMCDIIGETRDLRTIFTSDTLELMEIRIDSRSIFVKNIIQFIILNANHVSIIDNKIKLNCGNFKFEDESPFIKGKYDGSNVCIKSDELKGKYSEYDISSALYPVVPKYVFDKEDKVKYVNERTKFIGFGWRNFSGIQLISSKSIYPDNNIYRDNSIGVKNLLLNFRPEEFINSENQSTDYFIYAFIAPQPLNSKEKLEIEKYKDNDPEYYKGVHEGWSVLFLGTNHRVVVSPGIHSRNVILKKVPNNFWELYADKTYYLLDGTLVTKEYIDSL